MAEKTMPVVKDEKNIVKREVTRHPEYYINPPVDIYESDEGLVLLADMPGVDKEGLKVSVENQILTIEGKVGEKRKADYWIQEFEPINYFRQFELSEEVDQNKITAELKHGVLKLTLPKAEKAKPKFIEVKVS